MSIPVLRGRKFFRGLIIALILSAFCWWMVWEVAQAIDRTF